ncbi:hypothetical protein NKG05_09585 [Oerskovia sp. M15]
MRSGPAPHHPPRDARPARRAPPRRPCRRAGGGPCRGGRPRARGPDPPTLALAARLAGINLLTGSRRRRAGYASGLPPRTLVVAGVGADETDLVPGEPAVAVFEPGRSPSTGRRRRAARATPSR